MSEYNPREMFEKEYHYIKERDERSFNYWYEYSGFLKEQNKQMLEKLIEVKRFGYTGMGDSFIKFIESMVAED